MCITTNRTTLVFDYIKNLDDVDVSDHMYSYRPATYVTPKISIFVFIDYSCPC